MDKIIGSRKKCSVSDKNLWLESRDQKQNGTGFDSFIKRILTTSLKTAENEITLPSTYINSLMVLSENNLSLIS